MCLVNKKLCIKRAHSCAFIANKKGSKSCAFGLRIFHCTMGAQFVRWQTHKRMVSSFEREIVNIYRCSFAKPGCAFAQLSFAQTHPPCISQYMTLRILTERAVGVPSSLNSSFRFWLDIRKPGAMALYRMPDLAKWVASHWVKLEMAALAPE